MVRSKREEKDRAESEDGKRKLYLPMPAVKVISQNRGPLFRRKYNKTPKPP